MPNPGAESPFTPQRTGLTDEPTSRLVGTIPSRPSPPQTVVII